MPLPTNPDGSLRAFTPDEIALMEIKTRGVRDGSNPTHTREYNSSIVSQPFSCKWDEFENFLVYMLGAAVVYDDAGTDQISRLMPQTFPGKPQFACVKLVSATGHKFDGTVNDRVPQYTRAECVFQFDHVPFALSDDEETGQNETLRYLQVLPGTNDVQYLTLPGGTMSYWRATGAAVPHGKAVPFNIGKPLPTSIIARKWIRVPYEGWGTGTPLYERVFGDGTAAPYVGTVNKTDFLGYKAGQLLYLGVEEELDKDPLGDALCWTLTHRWMYKPYGHNQLYYYETNKDVAAPANGWYFVGTKQYYAAGAIDDDRALFNEKEHRNLFKVGVV